MIDARGQAVPEPVEPEDAQRRPVRNTAVGHDLIWLRSVIRWAMRWNTPGPDGELRYLMHEDPTRGYPIVREQNPRRPVATTDRYNKIAAVAAQVHPMLPVLHALSHYTGRRLGPIRSLRYPDLRLPRTTERPDGAIDWPAHTDKLRKRWANIALHPAARAALDAWLAEHPGLGAAYVFARPGDPTRPVDQDLVSKWLRRAEKLAKVEKHDGSLWHAYRRGWATARKPNPVQDVAAAGGWADVTVLQTIYQQPDPAGVRRAIINADELREDAKA